MKKIILLWCVGALFASCSGFLDTVPNDAVSSETFWKTPDDARKAVVGCYNDFTSGSTTLYLDCTSDIAYSNFSWEGGYKQVANGSMSSTSTLDLYGYTTIRRCNTFLAKIEAIPFPDAKEKANLIAQVRVIRAYKYAMMNQWYGGVPLANGLYETSEEAQLPRNTQAEVNKFVMDELDLALPDLDKDPESGRASKGMALALKMRTALQFNDYATALKAGQDIIALGKYDLEPVYSDLFTLKGQSSKEIIFARPYLLDVAKFGLVGQMYNNADGGWSSIVPTQNMVDMYEMANGKTITDPSSGYDPVHPFAGRDPRMYASILFPGMDWVGPETSGVLNTLDKEIPDPKKPGEKKLNPNYPTAGDNASKTGLTWGKYLTPASQYPDMWNTPVSPILYRLAEVYLTIAECHIEMPTGDIPIAVGYINEVRKRAGMPRISTSISREEAREALRRERCVELAGEGVRRGDIVRWTDASGKLVAETVLNGDLTRITGTIVTSETDPQKRAQIVVGTTDKIEGRIFQPYMRYLPFTQGNLDNNPNLKQNPGYL